MAQVTATPKGFKLTDTAKLKGTNLSCEFNYEVSGETQYPPNAGYFEKFRSYFAQDAAGTWNKAKVKAEKKIKGKFDAADAEFGKFVKDVDKYNIMHPQKTIKEKEVEYSKKLKEEFTKLIQNDIGPDLVNTSHAAAAKRIGKEGTKLKKSKAKIAFSVGKVVVKVAAIAAAAIATAATGGAAAPVLVAVVGWVAFSMSAAKKVVEAGKIVNKLAADTKKDTDQMEKKLAELDKLFDDAVKFANRLESKADAVEMATDNMKSSLSEATDSLSKVDPKSKEYAPKAKALQKKITELEGMMRDFGAMREYAPVLREALVAFRKVKNEATWGAKIDSSKKIISFLNDVGKGLESVAGEISQL